MGQETTLTDSKNVSIASYTASIMKSSLFVSLAVHLVALIILQKAFPIGWVAKPLRTYQVELLRPPIDPLELDQKVTDEIAKIGAEKDTPEETAEDTISLETKDKRYSSYAKIIKSRLLEHWEYPPEAWENLLEGDVLVLFSLNRQGHLMGIQVQKYSQHKILDDETTRTIRDAAPFPPFPGSVTVNKLNIMANFTYRLTLER